MIRVYRDFLQRMLILLGYMKQQDITIQQAASYGYGRYNSGNMPHGADLNILNQACYAHRRDLQGTGMETVDELLILVSQQLAQTEKEQAETGQVVEKDLIDTLVNSLQLPYARNSFGPSHMKLLKKVLLLPEELRKLKTIIARQEKYCSCGHEFKSGEVASTVWDEDGPQLFCAQCWIPSHISCPKCKGTALLTEKQRGFFQNRKVDCGCTLTPAERGEEVPTVRTTFQAIAEPRRANPFTQTTITGGSRAGARLAEAAGRFGGAMEAAAPAVNRTLRRTAAEFAAEQRQVEPPPPRPAWDRDPFVFEPVPETAHPVELDTEYLPEREEP